MIIHTWTIVHAHRLSFKTRINVTNKQENSFRSDSYLWTRCIEHYKYPVLSLWIILAINFKSKLSQFSRSSHRHVRRIVQLALLEWKLRTARINLRSRLSAYVALRQDEDDWIIEIWILSLRKEVRIRERKLLYRTNYLMRQKQVSLTVPCLQYGSPIHRLMDNPSPRICVLFFLFVWQFYLYLAPILFVYLC